MIHYLKSVEDLFLHFTLSHGTHGTLYHDTKLLSENHHCAVVYANPIIHIKNIVHNIHINLFILYLLYHKL